MTKVQTLTSSSSKRRRTAQGAYRVPLLAEEVMAAAAMESRNPSASSSSSSSSSSHSDLDDIHQASPPLPLQQQQQEVMELWADEAEHETGHSRMLFPSVSSSSPKQRHHVSSSSKKRKHSLSTGHGSSRPTTTTHHHHRHHHHTTTSSRHRSSRTQPPQDVAQAALPEQQDVDTRMMLDSDVNPALEASTRQAAPQQQQQQQPSCDAAAGLAQGHANCGPRNLLLEVLGAPVHELGQLTVVSRLGWSLPLRAITKVIKKAHLLTSLGFYSLGFSGSKRDFGNFCRALRNHPSLKELHLVDCHLMDQTIPIDELLSALAVIPTLETVEIYALDLDRETTIALISPSSLGDLCRSRSITTLDLQDLDLKDDHIQQVTAALETNQTLKTLTMWDCNVSDTSGQLLADMLQTNTCLEKVDLSFNDLRDASFQAMSQALRVNTTLRSLSLCGNTHIVKETRGAGSGYDAVVEVLRDGNHSIEEMILETPADPRVSLSLAINRNRHVLEDDTENKGKLVDCLSENGDHHSFLYFMLQANPELCDVDR